MDYIAFVVREGKMTDDRLLQISARSKDKEFLFGDEVHAFLKEPA